MPEYMKTLERLKRLKAESDRRNYDEKRRIFRELYAERPDEFFVDSDDGNILGITHRPTSFQFHLPRTKYASDLTKKGLVIGGITGGGLGAIIGLNTGGDTTVSNRVKRALVGAMIGTAVGGTAGALVGGALKNKGRTRRTVSASTDLPHVDRKPTTPVSSISRRDAWRNALGDRDRADVIIDSAANYRKDNPRVLEGIYAESDPDAQVPVFRTGDPDIPGNVRLPRHAAAMHRSPEIEVLGTGGHPGGWGYAKMDPDDREIIVTNPAYENNSLLLHEVLHRGSSPFRAQENVVREVETHNAKDPSTRIEDFHSFIARFTADPTPNAKHLNMWRKVVGETYGQIYPLDLAGFETITVLGEARAGLENLGVDTTDKTKVADFLRNSPDEMTGLPHELGRLLEFLNMRIGRDREELIKQISETIPAISKNKVPGGEDFSKYASDPELRAHIREEADRVDTSPTESRKTSGNYAKGHVSLHGLQVTIENPKGSNRSGVSPDGKSWSVKMPAHYGYIRRTKAVDGDHLDIYLGPYPESEKVFVVDQKDLDTGAFDEHKVFLGFNSEDQVTDVYDKSFSDSRGPERRKAVTPISLEALKVWMKGGVLRAPFAPEQSRNKSASDARHLHLMRVILKNRK